jgi:hypothetical protein
MLYASPLCYLNESGVPVAIEQIPFEREWDVLLQALGEATGTVSRGGIRREIKRPIAALAAQPLTAGILRRVLVPNAASELPAVLHLSAHGMKNGNLILDDGVGTAHFFGCDKLSGLLELRQSSSMHSRDQSPRLVILNACSSVAAGECLAQGGVPHVLCTAVDVRNSWSNLFFQTVYTALFQGESIIRSFEAAIIALQCDPEIPSEAAAAFQLLPKGGNHDEVLFPIGVMHRGQATAASNRRCLYSSRSPSSLMHTSDSEAGASRSCSASDGAADSDHVSNTANRRILALQAMPRRNSAMSFHRMSPFGRPVPIPPEDFVWRSLDVWAVLRNLVNRRAVVVCGADGTNHGIGKSAVIDCVHRNLTFQQGSLCVRVDLTNCRTQWIDQVWEATRRASQEERRRHSGGLAAHSARPKYSSKVPTSFSNRHRRGANVIQSRFGESAASTGAGNHTFEKMVVELITLSEIWEHTKNDAGDWSPVASSKRKGVVLILDGCEGLIMQKEFQEGVGEILRICPAYRVLIGTHQRMPAVGGQFKVVHHAIDRLSSLDSARLFLRRTHRPLRWGEIDPYAKCPDSFISLAGGSNKENEVLAAVARHPAIAAAKGHPRALIELAGQVGCSTQSLGDIAAAFSAWSSSEKMICL